MPIWGVASIFKERAEQFHQKSASSSLDQQHTTDTLLVAGGEDHTPVPGLSLVKRPIAITAKGWLTGRTADHQKRRGKLRYGLRIDLDVLPTSFEVRMIRAG